MSILKYECSEEYARTLDTQDELSSYRDLFLIPQTSQGKDCLYLTGNSLGLQPRQTRAFIEQELDDWAKWGVEGHLHARNPWLPYHEKLTEPTAQVVGAKPIEVVVMNTLSVNLHLMMVSFYRPNSTRHKILIEKGAFPSDQYAVASQIRFHGLDPKTSLLEADSQDFMTTLAREGSSIALILVGSVNYLTGRAVDIEAITRAGHAQGCRVGFDLAHGAGNLELKLHEWGPDFAVWCGYKYLNAGPGALSGCFVHERHSLTKDIPRFAGWWGQNKKTRFQMGPEFDPIPGAEGWQLSNPPIFQLAALRASLEIFEKATMPKLRAKSVKLTGYLEFLLDRLPEGFCTLITPRDPEQRGSQLSMKIQGNPQALLKTFLAAGVICDFREPNIIRAAPTALYNRFTDVFHFFKILEQNAKSSSQS